MAADISIAVNELDELQVSRCSRFVEAHETASVYHLPAWCELIRKVFGHRYYYLHAQSKNETTGVLPMVRLTSRLFGDYLVSVPFFNYGGAVGVNEQIEQELMQSAVDLGESLGISHIEFRGDKARHEDWKVRTDKVNMLLDLPLDEDVLWKALGAKRRSQINRPLREGVEVQIGKAELLNGFYEVFARNMRDLGTPVYSKEFFSEILKVFPDYTNIVLVLLKGKPAAAAFLIGYRGTLEIPWASTISEYNKFGINMFMYWEVLKFAVANQYKKFDFGRSTIDSGTYRFKKQWGAQPKQLYWHYWLRNGQTMPQLTTSNPKYQLAIKTWQRLPLFVANWIGPKIVKNLP